MEKEFSRGGFRYFTVFTLTSLAAFLAGPVLLAAKNEPAQTSNSADADRLIAEARQAELAGDSDTCYRLLREAVRVAPESKAAHWQLGQMQVGNEWVSVEEAQRRAAADPKQAEYRELRARAGETPQGQLELARWCRKNKLNEEALFHWASVLSVDPGNEEALKATGMQRAGGQLLTREQIAERKAAVRKFKEVIQEWKPKLAKWERAVGSEDPAIRDKALGEIRSIKSPAGLAVLESITLDPTAGHQKKAKIAGAIGLALVDAAENMPDYAATISLTRHSVWSPIPDVRSQAIEKLKSRPQHEFVPLLLSGLAMPLESSFAVIRNIDGSVHYRHSLYREGADSDWSFDRRLSLTQNDVGGNHFLYDVAKKHIEVSPPRSSLPSEKIKRANRISSYENRYASAAVATERQVWQANQLTEALNSLIITALVGATGEKLETPRAWWDWWRDHNEYASEDRTVDSHYYSDNDNYYYGFSSYDVRYPPPPPPPPRPPGKRSCFAKGTLVWTKTGQRPIETLELGDLILAQNVESGELGYKPLIGRTVRPPSEILAVDIAGEAIQTTLGHPFWVVGSGWKMAKELEKDTILHGVTGSARVTNVRNAEQAEAYNLVVADFNTYFVGERGVLVHDNTPRTPTRVLMPGVASK